MREVDFKNQKHISKNDSKSHFKSHEHSHLEKWKSLQKMPLNNSILEVLAAKIHPQYFFDKIWQANRTLGSQRFV